MNFPCRFSTLQRVEIAEIGRNPLLPVRPPGFSTLQRVEIAEMILR